MKKFICLLLSVMLISVPLTGFSAVDDISLSAVFQNYKGETLTTIKNVNYADVIVKIENKKTAAKNITVVIALYKNNEILRLVKAKNTNFKPGASKTYKTGMPIPKDKTGLKLRTYVLDENNLNISGEMVLQ